MELIEGWTSDLPVMLLVEIPKRDRVGGDLIQVLDRLFARSLRERNRHPNEMPERLNFWGLLICLRGRATQDDIGVKCLGAHKPPPASSTRWFHSTCV